MTDRASFSLPAPAKLNLGLEILGKRSDGFHELATIFVAISLFDTLDFTCSSEMVVDSTVPELMGPENLVHDAIRCAQHIARTTTGAQVTLEKRIPLAAGLGGASSDAATTLIGCERLWGMRFGSGQLHETAARLGSDVPFFLEGGCAFGQGRGEQLEPLTLSNDTWFVLVAPKVVIQDKTTTLFRELRPSDFSAGERIVRQAQRLKSTGVLDASLLVNAFTRPLYERVPSLQEIVVSMTAAGASSVAISGAGPSHYTVERDRERAFWIAENLRASLGRGALVMVVQPVPPRGAEGGRLTGPPDSSTLK